MSARRPGDDHFDDIMNRDDAGVFSGLGIDDFEGVKEQVSPDGLVITMNCRKCGKQHNVTLEWQELYIAGTNGPGRPPLLPPGWAYSQNNGKLYPANIPCTKCGEPLCPQITPKEARDRVEDAVSQQMVSPALVQQWQRQVAMYRQQQGG